VVSPELHRRPMDLGKLKAWQAADGICTDLPMLYAPLFAGDTRLIPQDVWWD